jgi:hypothetical protein
LSDSHDDALVLRQIQRLQGPEYPILVHGINFAWACPLLYAFRWQSVRSLHHRSAQETAHLP